MIRLPYSNTGRCRARLGCSPIVVVAGLLIIALAGRATAQERIFSFHGDLPRDELGSSVGSAGDVDGDGIGDILVGAPVDYHVARTGMVRIYAGADGSILHTFTGDLLIDNFGAATCGLGDIDRDGFDDVLVGAPWTGQSLNEPGYARVFSGRLGTVLFTVTGDGPKDRFGASVAGPGDVTGDGWPDFIVGAPQWTTGPGYARIFSGRDGSIVRTFTGPSDASYFGSALCGIGDLDGDGRRDVIIAAGNDYAGGPHAGSVWIFSGRTGDLLDTLLGEADDAFGSTVDCLGDLDGDGVDDFLVGATQYGWRPCVGHGYARVISGATRAVIHEVRGHSPCDRGGFAHAAGDVNGDGSPDFVVGAIHDDTGGLDSGSARIYSGATGALLYHVDGENAGDTLGRTGRLGDIDRDGLDDVILGANEFYDDEGPGYAWVIAGNEIYLNAAPRQVYPGERFTLTVRESTPGDPLLLAVLGVDGLPTFIPVRADVFDASGSWQLTASWLAPLATHTVTLRAFTTAGRDSAEESVRFQIHAASRQRHF